MIDAILLGPPVEGVTFLGGEPFAQAEAVSQIAEAVRRDGLSVITFTGYVYEDLVDARRTEFDRLLSATDLLIDGPFDKNQLDFSRAWVGSRNQRYHFLTERYAHLATHVSEIPNHLEIRIGLNGNIIAGGLAPPKLSKQILAAATSAAE